MGVGEKGGSNDGGPAKKEKMFRRSPSDGDISHAILGDRRMSTG